MMKSGYACAAALLLVPVFLFPAQVDSPLIQDVISGELKEARASWWGFDGEDATACLQAAIDSKVPRLIVDHVGKPWIVRPITLRSDQEIVFEKGVEVVAKRGEFKHKSTALLTGVEVKNVTLRGPGATLRMWRSDYAAEPYSKSEWRHGIRFYSSSNIQIHGLTIAESGGDGIYLGVYKPGVVNKDVIIRDVVCDKNHRQGISVIAAENLTIEDCVLSNTSGTPPMAGIDFEPNHPDECLVNCVMRRCRFANNAGGAIAIYTPPLKAASAPLSIRFEDCMSRGDQLGIIIVTGNLPDAAVKGSVDVVGCTFSQSKGPGITISNIPADGCKVRFENCTLENTASGGGLEAPVTITSRAETDEDLGGYDFGRLLIKDDRQRRPLNFMDTSGNVKLRDLKGTLAVRHDGAEETKTVLTDKLLTDWFPFLTMKKLPRVKLDGQTFQPLKPGAPRGHDLRRIRTRGAVRFALFAAKGDAVRFVAHYGQVAGRSSGDIMPLTVQSPNGRQIGKTDVPFKGDATVTFTAPETGLYRIDANTKGNLMSIQETTHRVLLTNAFGAMRLFTGTGDFYFYVPAGTREFGVKITGEGTGEGVKAALHGPDGRLIGEKDDIAAPHQFTVDLPQPSPGVVYKLVLGKASHLHLEDISINLLGIPPLLAPSPEALLAPEK